MKRVLLAAAAVLLLQSGCSETSESAEPVLCDPEAADADRQVVDAFLAAYNAEDLDRLIELAPVEEIWDLAGIPHLGQPAWTDIAEWANKGWEVEDRLELVKFTSYGPDAGSDIVVRRTNTVLRDAQVESFDFGFKVPSDGCTIERLIGGVGPFGSETGRCDFYAAFGERIRSAAPHISVSVEC